MRPPLPCPAARPLQELSLAGSPSLQGAKALAGLRAAPLPALRRVDLSRTRLRPDALAAIGAAPWCAALAELDVRSFYERSYAAQDIFAIIAALRAPPLAAMDADGRLRHDFFLDEDSGGGCGCSSCMDGSFDCACGGSDCEVCGGFEYY
jgi:hypothetical protein